MVLATALLISLLQWRGADAERQKLLQGQVVLFAQSLQQTSDQLTEWSREPTTAGMLAVRASWETVKMVHNTLLASAPHQWHQADPFDAFIDQFSTAGSVAVQGDRCLATRYAAVLEGWARDAERLATNMTKDPVSGYIQVVGANVGKLGLRSDLCP